MGIIILAGLLLVLTLVETFLALRASVGLDASPSLPSRMCDVRPVLTLVKTFPSQPITLGPSGFLLGCTRSIKHILRVRCVWWIGGVRLLES